MLFNVQNTCSCRSALSTDPSCTFEQVVRSVLVEIRRICPEMVVKPHPAMTIEAEVPRNELESLPELLLLKSTSTGPRMVSLKEKTNEARTADGI